MINLTPPLNSASYWLSSQLIWLVLLALSAPLHASDMALLQAQLDNIDSISANFDLINLDDQGQALNEQGGQLLFARPDLLRWQTKPPFAQLIISDGELIYQYDPDLEQVIIQPLGDDIQQTPILLLAAGEQQISENFTVELVSDSGGLEVFKLSNRDPGSLIASVELQFSSEHLLAIKINDTQQQSNLLLLNAIEQNSLIDYSQFEFSTPEGVDVLRYDE